VDYRARKNLRREISLDQMLNRPCATAFYGFTRVLRHLAEGTLLTVLLLTASAYGQSHAAVKIDLDQAIRLALERNHALKAARTQIEQSQAQEITAAIRPNPVFTYDDLFIPFFSPSQLNSVTLDNVTEFDASLGWTFERGGKRKARIRAARDQTAVTRSLVGDNERTLTFNVAQQFVAVLQAESTWQFAKQDLESFQKTVQISEDRLKAGDMSQADYLKIKLQLLQFQTDVSSAQLALVQARASLRALLGYDTVPADYEVAGELSYTPLHVNKEDLQAMALGLRPDLMAAKQGVTAAGSQHDLARANGKRSLTTSWTYSHVSALNNAGFTASIEIPIFDRNQGEIARTHYAIAQAEENQTAAEQTVLTDVANAYEAFQTADEVARLYESGYLKNAQDSRDISEFAYRHGAASLLDFLDAERSYRSTQLAYRQALGAYMLAVEQLKETVGTRKLGP
jgi:cobalt-zinc-cadmium efflux system outer membrane protein